MKALITAVLFMFSTPALTLVPVTFKQAKPDKTFETAFYHQIDVTNLAVKEFVNQPCSAGGEVLAAKLEAVSANVDGVADMTSKIPDSQDTSIQARELETAYGLFFLSKQMIQEKIDACKTPEPSTPTFNKTKGDK